MLIDYKSNPHVSQCLWNPAGIFGIGRKLQQFLNTIL